MHWCELQMQILLPARICWLLQGWGQAVLVPGERLWCENDLNVFGIPGILPAPCLLQPPPLTVTRADGPVTARGCDKGWL